MLDAATLIARAEDQMGVADSDAFVHTNLERLIDALQATSGMSAEGFAGAERSLLVDTVNRLEGIKWLRDCPEIALEPIEQPIFLMGLPRSGTTYLQYLFDCDDRFRQIRTWEALTPFPPPGGDPVAAEARRASWAARCEDPIDKSDVGRQMRHFVRRHIDRILSGVKPIPKTPGVPTLTAAPNSASTKTPSPRSFQTT